jgi:disulfide bond formation protein DsbB
VKKILPYLETPRPLALAIAAASAALLAAAYISQYGFGLKPCILCLYQRAPYALNVTLGLFAFAATFKYPRLARRLIWLAIVAFFANAAIAGFHVGVEQGWWPGLPSCGGDIVPQNASIEELRRALAEQDIVRCDTPAWTLFGVSMAGYNFMAALLLGGGALWLHRGKKNGA